MGRHRSQLRHKAPIKSWLVVVCWARDDNGAVLSHVSQRGVLGVNGSKGLPGCKVGIEVGTAGELRTGITMRDGVRLEAVVPHRPLHVLVRRYVGLIPAEDLR